MSTKPTINLDDSKSELWQWDTGRCLSLPDTDAKEVHISRGGMRSAHVVKIQEQKATIPDDLLVLGGRLFVYIVQENATGEMTVYDKWFDIRRRPKPEDYIYTEQEIKRWEQLEQRVDALEKDGAGGGTTDHTKLTNRDAADQHPIAAISELEAAIVANDEYAGVGTTNFDAYEVINAQGAVVEDTEELFHTTDYIEISPAGCGLKATASTKTGFLAIAFYDSAKVFLSGETGEVEEDGQTCSVDGNVPFPRGAKYIRLSGLESRAKPSFTLYTKENAAAYLDRKFYGFPTTYVVTFSSPEYDDEENATVWKSDRTYEEVATEIDKGTYIVGKSIGTGAEVEYYQLSTKRFSKLFGQKNAIMFYRVQEVSTSTSDYWQNTNYIALLEDGTGRKASIETPKFDDAVMQGDGRYAKYGLLYGGNCSVRFADERQYVKPSIMIVDVGKEKDGTYHVLNEWKTTVKNYLDAGGFAVVKLSDYNVSDRLESVFLPIKRDISICNIEDSQTVMTWYRLSDDRTKWQYISITGNGTVKYTEKDMASGGGLTGEQAAAITANTAARHTHSNKTILDSITAEKITEWDGKSDFSGSYNDLTDKPTISSGTPKWYEVASITTEEDLTDLIVNQDADGNMITAYNPLAINARVEFPADSTQTSATGQPWFFPQTVSVANDFRIIGNVSSWKTVARAVQYSWWGDGATINSNGSTTLGKSGNANINKITGFRIYVNASGDHIPVGTKVYVSVLGVKPS